MAEVALNFSQSEFMTDYLFLPLNSLSVENRCERHSDIALRYVPVRVFLLQCEGVCSEP